MRACQRLKNFSHKTITVNFADTTISLQNNTQAPGLKPSINKFHSPKHLGPNVKFDACVARLARDSGGWNMGDFLGNGAKFAKGARDLVLLVETQRGGFLLGWCLFVWKE